MITLDLNIKGSNDTWHVKDEILFNAIIGKDKDLIRKLIKSIHPLYRVKDNFFEVINNFVDFDSNNVSLYCGVIVRTNMFDYAVLYLEDTEIDEEYLISLIDEYIHDIGETPEEVNVTKFIIDRTSFLSSLKKL